MQKRSNRSIYLYLGILAVGTAVIRLCFASSLELASDEAYYFMWSRELKLTYFDHPPLIAWLIRAGTGLVGETSVGVRLLCILMVSGAVFIVYPISTAAGLSPKYAALASSLAIVLPAPSTGAILATPDTPLAFCWLLGVLALVRLVSRTSPLNWYLFFVSAGFGLLAKHSALLMLLMAGIALLVSKRLRDDLRTAYPWVAITLFAVIILPYLVAEIAAGFPSVGFQTSHLSGDFDGQSTMALPILFLKRLAELIGGQIGLLTPLVFGWVVIALAKKDKKPVTTILLAGLLVPIVAAALSAFLTHPEQNWASLGHPIAAVLAMVAIGQKRRFWWVFALLASTISVTAIIHAHTLRPFLPLPPERDPVSRLHGWNGLKELSENAKSADTVVCDNYGLASQFSWVFRSEKIQAIGLDRPHSIKPGTWLLLDEKNDYGRAELYVSCENLRPLQTLTLRRADGIDLRKIDVYLGERCASR